MLVPARVGLALRCPRCGKTAVHELSLFELSGNPSVRLDCSCGQHQATLSRRRGRLVLQVPCFLCDGLHHLPFRPGRFWQGVPQAVVCQETGLHLGMVGSSELAREFADPAPAQSLVDPGALSDYFVNPEVMYEVLAAVHELDEAGRLRCRCGNADIDYELQPDRLNLVCPRCGSRRSLGAATEADVSRARRARRLEVGGPSSRPGEGRP